MVLNEHSCAHSQLFYSIVNILFELWALLVLSSPFVVCFYNIYTYIYNHCLWYMYWVYSYSFLFFISELPALWLLGHTFFLPLCSFALSMYRLCTISVPFFLNHFPMSPPLEFASSGCNGYYTIIIIYIVGFVTDIVLVWVLCPVVDEW
jgi:hypothetical protein